MDARHHGGPDQVCRICGILNRDYAQAYNLPIAESENFFAAASIGGFVPGWALVCPKAHRLNLAELYESAEFLEFSGRIARAVGRAYDDPVVVFEHGCRRAGSMAGCGTNHAHLHLVPFHRMTLEAAVRRFDPTSQWVMGPARDVNRLFSDQEYLLMAQSLHDLSAVALMRAVGVPQSQYFRLAIANALGRESTGNYRTYPFVELASQTASRLLAELRSPVAIFKEVA